MASRILCAIPEGTYSRIITPALDARLKALGEVTFCPQPREMSEREYGALWAGADAVVTGWGVRPPTPEMIDAARDLRIVSHTAGSVRMFPRYLIEKGIVVTSARGAIARSVAEFSLLNALTLLRRYPYYVDSSPGRRAFYAPDGAQPATETLYDKTVGLVGFGFIGRLFRKLLAPFECRVLVYDPFLTPLDAEQEDVQSVALDELLRESKVVSLHAPDIPETAGLIGAKELALLQDGAIFLNSARGRLVDTGALTGEVAAGRFYAAIDVTDPEPLPADHALRTMPNVVFTPHIAGPTTDELPRLAEMALDDLERFLNGQPPLYPIDLRGYDLMSF